MVNSLWCPFLWRRWIAVVCEYNNGACGERFMWKRCGSFQCPWNHGSVTSRLCPREKMNSMCDRVKLLVKRNKLMSSLSFVIDVFQWIPSDFICETPAYHVRTHVNIYICIYLYVCTDLVIGLVVCLFDWYAYEYVGSPSLFVEPLGSFVGGPPLCYIWLSKSL